ncbi:anti-sigma factor family protein [Aquipuribacter hungaricus]|uniref:Anti-sigma factor family protein n=1 Tax=Aquipuribacter hungaricus TaxID=545624 RepID=A0ABV7WB74_9MICO
MLRLPHPRTALSGYADRRLPAWQRAVVRRHLRGCTRCAVEVARTRALTQALRQAPPPVPGPSDALLDRLLALGDAGPAADPAAGPQEQPGTGSAPGAPPVPVLPPDAPPDVPPHLSLAGASVVAHPAGRGPHERPAVGAAGVLVAAAVMVGTVGAGAVVTGTPLPWSAAVGRASVHTVVPRLFPPDPPGGAPSVRPVDDGARP